MPRSSPTGTTPHPPLTKYYDSERDRQPFVTALFDGAAKHYDCVTDLLSLGSGRFYRRWVLRESGLKRGMTLLDVATGTGLIARSAVQILGSSRGVVGIDASAGMLAEARKAIDVRLVQGQAEALPFRDDRFDFLAMSYALRHVADLGATFAQCHRVLKPGGRFLLLEISRPRSTVIRGVLRIHLELLTPLIAYVTGRGARVGMLTHYYWDTIAACVPPETILEVLRASGFADVQRRARGGLLSEYLAVKPHEDRVP